MLAVGAIAPVQILTVTLAIDWRIVALALGLRLILSEVDWSVCVWNQNEVNRRARWLTLTLSTDPDPESSVLRSKCSLFSVFAIFLLVTIFLVPWRSTAQNSARKRLIEITISICQRSKSKIGTRTSVENKNGKIAFVTATNYPKT